MIEQTLLIFIGIALVLIALAIPLMARQLFNMKQQLQKLQASVDGESRDIAGLCSAAIQVDDLLFSGHQRLLRLADQVAGIESRCQESGPYGDAIEKISRGAGVEEIMKECGLSRDEASLLLLMRGKTEGR